MPKITIPDVTDTPGSLIPAINVRFQQVEDEFNVKVLYRDNPIGEPNESSNDYDLNGNDLLNVGTINADTLNLPGGLTSFNPSDDETITGSWGFTQEVIGIDPTSPQSFATKNYVDNSSFDTTANYNVTGLWNFTPTGGVTEFEGGQVLVTGSSFDVTLLTAATITGGTKSIDFSTLHSTGTSTVLDSMLGHSFISGVGSAESITFGNLAFNATTGAAVNTNSAYLNTSSFGCTLVGNSTYLQVVANASVAVQTASMTGDDSDFYLATKKYVDDNATTPFTFNKVDITSQTSDAPLANTTRFYSGARVSNNDDYNVAMPDYTGMSPGDFFEMYSTATSGGLGGNDQARSIIFTPDGVFGTQLINGGSAGFSAPDIQYSFPGSQYSVHVKFIYSGDATVGWLSSAVEMIG